MFRYFNDFIDTIDSTDSIDSLDSTVSTDSTDSTYSTDSTDSTHFIDSIGNVHLCFTRTRYSFSSLKPYMVLHEHGYSKLKSYSGVRLRIIKTHFMI